MKIAVIGAGAIGGVVAVYLKQKGEDVELVVRADQKESLERNGLSVKGVRGEIHVTLPITQKLQKKTDLVIVATKTQDLEIALKENLSELKAAYILSVQNGLRAEEIIKNTMGIDSFFSSIVMFGATYLSPGEIVHNFEGDWIIGSVGSIEPQVCEEVVALTSKIFPSPISDNIIGMKWLKLFLNANNCIPALINKSMQEAFRNMDLCNLSLAIWREGWQVLERAGISLESLPTFPAERIPGLLSLPQEKASGIFSGIMTSLSEEPLYGSVLQSIKRNRLSEIDYINGEFHVLAQSINTEAPLNARLVEMVHQVESTKRFFTDEELVNQTKELIV